MQVEHTGLIISLVPTRSGGPTSSGVKTPSWGWLRLNGRDFRHRMGLSHHPDATDVRHWNGSYTRGSADLSLVQVVVRVRVGHAVPDRRVGVGQYAAGPDPAVGLGVVEGFAPSQPSRRFWSAYFRAALSGAAAGTAARWRVGCGLDHVRAQQAAEHSSTVRCCRISLLCPISPCRR